MMTGWKEILHGGSEPGLNRFNYGMPAKAHLVVKFDRVVKNII